MNQHFFQSRALRLSHALLPVLALAGLMLITALPAQAVQLQDLVRVKGGENNKLVGMGLVVGLKGTGDGGKYQPAMRPLAAVIQQLIDPTVVATELKDTKNVALVALTANLPAEGVREGDRVNVHVSAVGSASSLAGGRLFLIPMTGPLPGSPTYAFAEGPVTIEDPAIPTVGVVRLGAQLTRDIFARYMDEQSRITLVLHDSVASVPMASNMATLINDLMSPDGDQEIAIALDGRNVVMVVPEQERRNPARFISQILLTDVDPSLIPLGARVVINEKTGTIIVSGEVEISPVIIMHKGLTITTVTPVAPPTPLNPRVEQNHSLALDPQRRGGSKLADLLTALNQLKVDAADRIAIVREIHRSGKLHAQLIEE